MIREQRATASRSPLALPFVLLLVFLYRTLWYLGLVPSHVDLVSRILTVSHRVQRLVYSVQLYV